ncbi:unnamed protein product [Polarella glacialis]|uniref:Protein DETOXIFICATION n=1 Tax=Polarella glacialis TaxID=89957 RepID=A0A813FFE0_POLGL|nr:unnamed protein product [Polarella glacialis]
MSPELLEELRIWWAIVWPAMLTNWCRMGMELTDVSILGHYHGGVYLASSSYASIVLQSVMVIVVRGMGGNALNAFCSSAYGAGNYKLLGLYLQIALFSCTCVALCLAPIWIWGGNILSGLVGHDQVQPSDAQDINLFLRISLLWILPLSWTSCLNSFLVSQRVVLPQTIIFMTGLLLNFGINFLLICGFGLGYPGSPLATAFSRWFVLLALVALVRSKRVKLQPGVWDGWDLKGACQRPRVATYLKQALPTALSGMIEEYQLQTIAVFAGQLGPQVVATHNATLILFLVLCGTMWAISQATSTRIGHHLGSSNLPGVKRVIRLASIAAALWGLLVSVVITSLHRYLGDIYSSKLEVQLLAQEISSLAGMAYFLLAIFYVSMSILTSSCRQGWIVAAFVAGAWGVSVPVGRYLAFFADPDWFSWYPARLDWDIGLHGEGAGLLGLWLGLVCGYAVTTLVAVFGVCRSDWPKLMAAAVSRAELRGQGQLLSPSNGLAETGVDGVSLCEAQSASG